MESYGSQPVIVYAPEDSAGEAGTSRGERHGNFFDSAYAAICLRPEWVRRFNKIHAQGRAIPKLPSDPTRKWREIDSSMSSDALLMNVFCTPGVAEAPAVRLALGVESDGLPEFGWKARVPLKSGLVDRTEVDMRWGSLLVEAKLTESDFQTRKASIVEAYRDFDEVFDQEMLPRVKVPLARRKEAVEFPEEFTQEYEGAHDLTVHETEALALDYQAGIVVRALDAAGREVRYASYQLIRNVLAAYGQGCSFCVIHDERRPDLREAWFQVMAGVKSAAMRVRLKVLTWQELAPLLPGDLQAFLDRKYGIAAPGRHASPLEDELGPEA